MSRHVRGGDVEARKPLLTGDGFHLEEDSDEGEAAGSLNARFSQTNKIPFNLKGFCVCIQVSALC